MAEQLVMGRGPDSRWHLWLGKTGGGVVSTCLKHDQEGGSWLEPPKTWVELGAVDDEERTEAADSRPAWDCVVAYEMARRVVTTVLAGQVPVHGAAAAAHAAWWLGEGGPVRTISVDDAAAWFRDAGRRGGWMQLELPEVE